MLSIERCRLARLALFSARAGIRFRKRYVLLHSFEPPHPAAAPLASRKKGRAGSAGSFYRTRRQAHVAALLFEGSPRYARPWRRGLARNPAPLAAPAAS